MECRKILLVDDREENLYSLGRILSAIDNVELLKTNDPEKALRLCLQHDFSLAILDVQMPGMDGYELAGLLRGNEPTQGLPIIFLSAISVADHHVAKGYASGATDFIVKPVRAEILIAKVKVFLQLDDANRRLQSLVEERTLELSLSETKYRETFEHAPVGIAHVDHRGKFVMANTELCKILGYSNDELINKSYVDIIYKEDLSGNSENLDKIFNKEMSSFSMEKRYVHKQGHIVWILLNIVVIRDSQDNFLYAIALIQDISEEKRITEVLRSAKEEAESSNRAKSQFLANMSHELRTPLNPIIGLSELMLQEKPDEESLEKFMDIINKAGHHMLLLISEILNFSKLQAGKVASRMEWAELFDPFDEVANMLGKQIHEKGLQFKYDRPEKLSGLEIYTDLISVRQITANLLGNAIKFTDSGFIELKVNLERDSETEGTLYCEVNDSGIGISRTHQDRIWEAFERMDNSMSSVEKGTGLGLSICKLQVSQLNGSISLKSEPGKGSCFKYNIPVSFREKDNSEKKASGETPDESQNNTLNGLKILSVDDDSSNQVVTKEMLKRMNHSCTCCYSGKEALEILENQEFDLVLMDLKMPDMDGIECTRRIHEKYSNEPPFQVVALTANVVESAEIDCAEVGMKGFLKKPLSSKSLKALLDKVQENQTSD